MMDARYSGTRRTIPFLIVACLLAFPAQAQYGGGTGEPNDPYLIGTAADLIALGETPEHYDRHFILTADIDLDCDLPGRKVFDRAVIAPDTNDVTLWFEGTEFTGVFDGDGHTISHLTITGENYLGLFGMLNWRGEVRQVGLVDVNVSASGEYVGGLAGDIHYASIIASTSTGTVHGNGSVGGLAGHNSGSVIMSSSAATVTGNGNVGGLVGYNARSITASTSTGAVEGSGHVGGLVGHNRGSGNIANCYSTGTVTGDAKVGGLVGYNWWADIATSYSTGRVTGDEDVGGLVGEDHESSVRASFWDIESSGQTRSDGGDGRTTAGMQTASTFLNVGWDFMGERDNGADNIWGILEARDYPRLAWELWASSPDPPDGATDVFASLILSWRVATEAAQHDVYFSDDEDAVADATTECVEIYLGRQPGDVNTHAHGELEWGRTYYWRIDEVNEADLDSPWKGDVWTFTTADFALVRVVDDFESYTNEVVDRVFRTWIDGVGFTLPKPGHAGNGTGAMVGHDLWDPDTPPPYGGLPIMETDIVHGGWQSMPLSYDNATEPYYSEAERAFTTPSYWTPDGVESPQDWTVGESDTLTLYFHGDADNDPESLYVAIEDSAGRVAVVTHPDADAVLASEWRKWHIALADLEAAGVDVSSVGKIIIGIGDRDNPQPGGTGTIYIDDITVTNRMP